MNHPLTLDSVAAKRAAKQGATSWAVLVCGLSMMVAVSFLVDPNDIESGKVFLSPTCPTKSLFGRECPTCGMTRGFAALSHGRFTEAMRYNRASPFAYGLTWAGIAWGMVGLAKSVRAMRRAEARRGER